MLSHGPCENNTTYAFFKVKNFIKIMSINMLISWSSLAYIMEPCHCSLLFNVTLPRNYVS